MTVELQRAQGFTLLELLMVLLISGILLGIGLGVIFTEKNGLNQAAQLLVTAAVTARSQAMLRNAPVTLQLSPGAVVVRDAESRWEKAFAHGVEALSVNGRQLMGDARLVIFQPLGLVQEQVVVMSAGADALSVYIPATGSPLVLEGSYSLERIRKEYL